MTDQPHEVTPGLGPQSPESGPVPTDPHVGPARQDESDVNIRGIGQFLAWMVVSLALVAGLVYLQVVWLQDRLTEERPPAAFRAAERLPPPEPTLQKSPRDEMRVLRASQERALEQAAWVDRDRGIVQIPIDRAMKRLVREGFPNWPPVPTATPSPTAAPSSTATPVSTAAPSPSPTRPAASPTASPTAAPSPTPTGSPSPTSRPTPERQP